MVDAHRAANENKTPIHMHGFKNVKSMGQNFIIDSSIP